MAVDDNLLSNFISDRRGQFAVIGALTASLLAFFGFAAIEFSKLTQIKTSLQDAADAAVIAAARELSVSNASNSSISSVVTQKFQDAFFVNSDKNINKSNTTIDATISDDKTKVSVKITLDGKVPPLLQYALNVENVIVKSAATISSSTKICVIGLDESASGVVQADHDSQINANNCAVFANSKAPDAVKSNTNARIKASLICSSGGMEGANRNFDPMPTLDCPAVGDPLAERVEPEVGPCTEPSRVVVYENRTLQPGVYCGGLAVVGTAKATLRPGVYIMKDGPLEVVNDASLVGTNVGFFFTGPNATFQFSGNSTIDLFGRESGEMAGLLMFESRSQNPNVEHLILTKNANRLVGTLYLPRTVLKIDTNGQVSEESPYTAIIARRLHVFQNANVVLNTNYEDTDVPVPSGIAGSEGSIRLVN